MISPKFSLPTSRRRIAIPESGLFPCPKCQRDLPFLAEAIHETTGLLGRFVPGVRGKLVAVVVTCRACNTQYPSEVRDRPLFVDRGRDFGTEPENLLVPE